MLRLIIYIFLVAIAFFCRAEYNVNQYTSINLELGDGEFAPFYQRANRFGKITQSKGAQLDYMLYDSLETKKKFDFGWGAEFIAGIYNKVDYPQWNEEGKVWIKNEQGPANIWIQQLYGEVKWRSLFLSIGLKDRGSCFVDQNLSSGDLLWSGNSRGIPEVRIGFIDFQDIPLTKKFLQVDACISYGKFIDTDWIDHHFDFWKGKMNPGSFWTYKRITLRSKQSNPFAMQLGFQMSGIFGGKAFYYDQGKLYDVRNNYTGFKDFFYMLLPISYAGNGEGYRVGDHKGTWDIAARYNFKNGMSARAYTQWFWEDSSGLAKQNGWDGLWGVEFSMGHKWWINKAVIEYLDLTHMSGPIIFDPSHNAGSLPYKADGGDGYYNNFFYRSYVNYGLNMGTPMVQGILFNNKQDETVMNNDEIPRFRVRGFHFALNGNILENLEYWVKYNHRKAWGGTNRYALIHPAKADSFYIGALYKFHKIPGLSISASFAFDRGNLPSNSMGGSLTLRYENLFSFKRHFEPKINEIQ